MKQLRLISVIVALLTGFLATSSAMAQLSANPTGFAVAVEQNDTLTQQLTLTNNGDQDLNYKIKFASPAHHRRMQGPRRDDPVEGHFAYFKDADGGWGNFDAIWQQDQVDMHRYGSGDFPNAPLEDYDVVWIAEYQSDDFNTAWNNNRGRFEDWVDAGGVIYMSTATNNWNVLPVCIGGIERIQGGASNGTVAVTDDENAQNYNYLATLMHWQGGEQLPGNAWAHSSYRAQQFEAVDNSDYYQVIATGENQQDLIGVAVYNYGRGLSVVAGTTDSHQYNNHRGENAFTWGNAIIQLPYYLAYLHQPAWVVADPKADTIRAGENADLNITFTPKTMAAGTYELLLGVVLGQDANPTLQMSCVMTVSNSTAAIAGTVTDPATHQPVEGVTASLDKYLISRTSDADGHYTFDHLPAAAYQVTFSAPDYLPETHNVDLGDNDAALDVALLHSECNLSQDQVNQDLAPGADTHVDFSVTNGGNGPLTYTNELRLIGDANAAPWDDRRDFNAGATLHDDRIEGVAFDGDHFYFAGANAANPNTIYVVDRDGNETNHYTQLGNSVYGMKDLEFDGELLWGSGETNIYGFRPNGDSVIAFRGPFNPNNNIAYDSDEGLLWISGTTTNIAAYDREGNAVNRVLNRKGLRIYGMAYWPQDPDGYKLYIFDQPAAGLQLVHKMNTRTGDTLLARSIPVNNGEAPSGIFICNTYDVYSWVMMSMHNVAPANGNDRMSIWQLDARKDWMAVDPTAGVIQAGDHQDFDLHLNATGLPAVQFQGVLVFTHDGVHGETRLPITLNVVAGPVHAERTLHMTQGWNLVSANLQPDNHDVTALTQSLTDQGQLIIMKDGAGHFYLPAQHFNNIPSWDVAQGYFLKLTQDADLTLAGQTVMADDPIELIAGWQAVSYYPRNPIDATVALTGIADHLIIVKDGLGNFYIPARNFSNMGQMVEGQGYMMKTDASQQLVYHTGNRADLVERASRPLSKGLEERASRPLALVTTGGTPVLPHYYPSHVVTGSNMSLLVEGSGLEGDIGVYANNVLVGSGALNNGFAGIAVWGDDPTTEAIDGATEGEPLELRLWDGSGERPLAVTLEESDLTYHTDGLVVASAEASKLPTNFIISAAYPNPFNSVTRIGFALPTASRVSVKVFDTTGREVATLVSGQLAAGNHAGVWNADTAPAGVYLLRLEAAGQVRTQKVVLVK